MTDSVPFALRFETPLADEQVPSLGEVVYDAELQGLVVASGRRPPKPLDQVTEKDLLDISGGLGGGTTATGGITITFASYNYETMTSLKKKFDPDS
jgi:hypothetical protein